MVQAEILNEENEIAKLLRSIICLQGAEGLPLSRVNEEYQIYVGSKVPYEKMGYTNLRDFVSSLPEIYLVRDSMNNEVLIEQSRKTAHIKSLIVKQKKKRKSYNAFDSYSTLNDCSPKKPRNQRQFAQNAFYHNSINTDTSQSERFMEFEQLETMLPLFYNHQAMGDEFFLDIADTKYGYYIPDNGPKKCGLIEMNQTIKQLIGKVKEAKYIAPRVVVSIGFHDLLNGSSVNQMITDYQHLITELKKRTISITLLTLVDSPKLPTIPKLLKKMAFFNQAILEYTSDIELQCNVIDMNLIFEKEAQAFNRDLGRFRKLAKKDPYKVFSDYGRKTFLAALRTCLREQIDAEH